ncbi:MAG: sigma-70 family RNA polymerase sigma factor [Phaeodactylibacter sp.]|nr:sigma-70 family RNA polymerase sigma factor [Phaeodactylibacter sp.]
MNQAPNIDDERIVQLLQAQPRDAIALILNKYGGALLWTIRKVVQNEAVAEDLLQDACVKIWKNADQYDPSKGGLFSWLVKICRNTAIDRARTKIFQARQTSKIIDETVANNRSFSTEMQTKDIGLHRQLQKLDPKYRLIIELLYFEGYTQREITEKMGIPLGTVKSRAKIAVRELRELLGDQEMLGLLALLSSLGWL